MNSDYKDKPSFKSEGLFRSFFYAWRGIYRGIFSERNLKIHLLAAVLVVIFAFVFKVSAVEWLFLLFAVGGVISLELVNTAIERTVDMMTEEYHPLAEQAKDMAAGAVLIYTLLSVAVGAIIFLPKIAVFVKNMFL